MNAKTTGQLARKKLSQEELKDTLRVLTSIQKMVRKNPDMELGLALVMAERTLKAPEMESPGLVVRQLRAAHKIVLQNNRIERQVMYVRRWMSQQLNSFTLRPSYDKWLCANSRQAKADLDRMHPDERTSLINKLRIQWIAKMSDQIRAEIAEGQRK